MDSASDAPSLTCSLERSYSQQSVASSRSRVSSRSARSTTLRARRSRRLLNQPPSSSASSIAASDKSLTSFPSFCPDPHESDHDNHDEERLKTATQESENHHPANVTSKSFSIVDTLAGKGSSRDSLFQDAPLRQSVPGALHQADDKNIERLIARNGAVSLVRQIAEDLAQRDGQIAALRRRADRRERALRRIIRECGLSNMDLENRLKIVESEMRLNERKPGEEDDGLSHLMSDAMQDTMATRACGLPGDKSSTIRASTTDRPVLESSKSTLRGWKDYLWGTGTVKRSGSASDTNRDDTINNATMIVRSQSSLDKRPTLQEDLFVPPAAPPAAAPAPPNRVNTASSSRASSVYSAATSERKASASLASLALRLVAGATMTSRDAESRGRAASATARAASIRAGSAASIRSAHSGRAASVVVNPKTLMVMRRISQAPQGNMTSAKTQPPDNWASMANSPPDPTKSRQESYGPVEMDAILPPELQPPTLSHIYNNYSNNNNNNTAREFLTDRFGFIYDQRRKKRQREAAHVAADQMNKCGRTEMLTNGRTRISTNVLEDGPDLDDGLSSTARSASPSSHEERPEVAEVEDGKVKRWQDYLKIATFPTELLSHTPGMNASALEVLEEAGSMTPEAEGEGELDSAKTPTITATSAGLVPPSATATTAVDSDIPQPLESGSTVTSAAVVAKDDAEPVKLLLEQLSEVHDSLQRDKTVKWNDFLRKVRAERRREGEAAVAAAAAVAEARYETPAVMTPEALVADGEIIGIAGLGNKGKVGRAKWNEFKALVLGGIPVAYRAKVWSECSGANALRIPGYYEGLVAQNGGDNDDPTVVSQIQMDIHRTLTDNIFFRKGPGVQKLSELLLAYSRRNKDVGYCQGMNLIAANLLLITPSAEDAFWILASIIESILPHGYYDQSLMASRADQQVLRQFVSTVLPKLSAHLDSLSIELEALTFQWFLSVFTDCLSAEALFRVWDVVLCTNDGSTFLFQIALALLKLNERNLLQCDTAAGVYTYINHHMTEHAISIDGLIQAGEALRRVIRREDIEQRRNKAMQAEKDMVAERDRARKQKADAAGLAAVDGESSNMGGDKGEPESLTVATAPIAA
ncbi:hypothetical protein E4U43_007791 [Claviceps pusilla]|uniref:Rab-GAP TBC domain-containing protein n=1 Tax=Claviceps pusilla TaxID=123648 RepID=A0A9P7NEB9_9HYPO|nr:hypothetical protein E4U43_007791 [Claviceps pusilla]